MTEQTIFRTVLTRDFTTLPNALLRDASLSYKARGILAMLLTNRDDWQTHLGWIEEQGQEGREAIRSGVQELEAAGYMVNTSREREGGQFTGSVWTVYDTPVTETERSNKTKWREFFEISQSAELRVPVTRQTVTRQTVTRQTADGFPTAKKDQEKKDQFKEEPVQQQPRQAEALLLPQEQEPEDGFPASLVRDLWNTHVPSLPKIRDLNGERLRHAKARARTLRTLADWQAFFKKIEASDFLTGRAAKNNPTARKWEANLDWCLTPANFDKILEGRYDHRQTPTRTNDDNPNEWSKWTKP